jgi:hypothetical protein
VEKIRQLKAADAFNRFEATLHSHTRYSDGKLSPTSLIDAAARQGMHTVAITDHDTMNAYTAPLPEGAEAADLFDYASQRGIELISGVELTCWWKWHPVHVLAYGLDPADVTVRRVCRMTKKAGTKRYRLAWWPVQAMSVCNIVLALGGVPVLAHPRFYWVNVRRMVEELVDLGGLMGVETDYEYRTHHLRLQCPVWTEKRIAAIVEAHGLLRTGGADSHGPDLTVYR